MKRGTFTRYLLGCSALAAGLAGCASPALVPAPQKAVAPVDARYVEGVDYHRLDPAQATSAADDRVEVVELFLYACVHCSDLEPRISRWLQGKQDVVDFRYLPAIVGPPWADQARAFYTAEKLGILERAHHALFESIHREGQQYASDRSVMDFFVGLGVDSEEFRQAYTSEEVAEKVSLARVMTVRYGVRGVPAVVVNGRYVTAQYFTGSQQKMIEVVDMLVEREQARMGGGRGAPVSSPTAQVQ